jgi:hypothetical protein
MKKKVRKFAMGGTTAEMNLQRFSPQTLVETVNPMASATLPKLGKEMENMGNTGVKGIANKLMGKGPESALSPVAKELTKAPELKLTSVSVEKGSDKKEEGMKRGGVVKKKSTNKPKVSSASKRADGCITKGKTKGRMV